MLGSLRRFAPTLAVATAVATSSSARAEDLQVAADPAVAPAAPTPPLAHAAARPAPPPPSAPPSSSTFYGWQNILVGELGLGIAIGTAALDAPEAGALGGIAYFFGGPCIHGAHGGGLGKVFGALALNVAVPGVGASIGAASSIGQDFEAGQAAALGALIGMAVAPIADGLILGWETRSSRGDIGGATPTPTVGLARTRDGWRASVAGTF